MNAKRLLCAVLVGALVLNPLPALAEDGPQPTAEDIVWLDAYGPLTYQPADDCPAGACAVIQTADQGDSGGGDGGLSSSTWLIIGAVVVLALVLSSSGGDGDGMGGY